MDRKEFLLAYLRELRMLNESHSCHREIDEVLDELRKYTSQGELKTDGVFAGRFSVHPNT